MTFASTASAPVKATYENLGSALKKIVDEKEATTLLGYLPTTQGLLIVLFSHRYNEDSSIVVSGSDHARTLAKVYEFLATAGRRRQP